jgi:hypothetical protein
MPFGGALNDSRGAGNEVSMVSASAQQEALSHKEVVDVNQSMKRRFKRASGIRREFLVIGLSLFG